jgi:nucleoside-diphosphate-sugar epimerase
MNTSYLVTGGAGFIGSHIVHTLVSRGERVRVLDNFSTGRRENLASVENSITVIEADVRDLPAVQEATRGVDYVLHQAALPSVAESVADPLTANEVNVRGTLNVLTASRDAGVKRLVLASSCAIYGNNPELPKRETMLPTPLSPYAATKLAGESYCSVFSQVYALPTVCLRYFNVFGPRQDPHSEYSAVIAKFIHLALKGEPLTIFGDGAQSRDFVYVANVVQANLQACTAPLTEGQVINIGSGDRYSLLDLVELLRELLQAPHLPVVHKPPRPGDVLHSSGDISRARELLGYHPEVDFATGLGHTINYFRQVEADA